MSVVSPVVTITVHAVPAAQLTLQVDKTEGYLGDTFNFSGVFMQNGTPVPGGTVTLYMNTTVAGSAVTDGAGNYVIPWVANIEGFLSFHTEAPQPPLPPLRSPTLGLGIGLTVPTLVELLAPFVASVVTIAVSLGRGR